MPLLATVKPDRARVARARARPGAAERGVRRHSSALAGAPRRVSLWERAQLGAAAALEGPASRRDGDEPARSARGAAQRPERHRGDRERAGARCGSSAAAVCSARRCASTTPTRCATPACAWPRAPGRRLDDAQPMVDARLADGSRLNVVLPPLAPDGPLLTLRRFAPRPFTLAELVELGSLSRSRRRAARSLRAARGSRSSSAAARRAARRRCSARSRRASTRASGS